MLSIPSHLNIILIDLLQTKNMLDQAKNIAYQNTTLVLIYPDKMLVPSLNDKDTLTYKCQKLQHLWNT